MITAPLTLAPAPIPGPSDKSDKALLEVWKEGTYLRGERASLNSVQRAAVGILGHGTPNAL